MSYGNYNVNTDPDKQSDEVDVYYVVASSNGTSAYVDLSKDAGTYSFPVTQADTTFFDRLRSPGGIMIGVLIAVAVVCLIIWLTLYEHDFKNTSAAVLFIVGVVVPAILSLILYLCAEIDASRGMSHVVKRYILEQRRAARNKKNV